MSHKRQIPHVSKRCCYFIRVSLFLLHTSTLIFELNRSEPIENYVDIIARFNFGPNESSYVALKYMYRTHWYNSENKEPQLP